MSKKTSWVLIPFAYDLENKQSYKSFFLSGIFIIYISEVIYQLVWLKKQTEIATCHLVNNLKNIPQKQTNKQTKTSKYIVRIK